MRSNGMGSLIPASQAHWTLAMLKTPNLCPACSYSPRPVGWRSGEAWDRRLHRCLRSPGFIQNRGIANCKGRDHDHI